jgi:hypothetical protein
LRLSKTISIDKNVHHVRDEIFEIKRMNNGWEGKEPSISLSEELNLKGVVSGETIRGKRNVLREDDGC